MKKFIIILITILFFNVITIVDKSYMHADNTDLNLIYEKTSYDVKNLFNEITQSEDSDHTYRYRFIEKKEPTCTEDGFIAYTNNFNTGKMTIHAIGHNFEYIETINPTCELDGEIIYKCTNCEELNFEYIPALGHNYEYLKTIEPTCIEVGYIYYKCWCEDIISEQIPIIEHTWEKTSSTVADCINKSTITYTCSKCNITNTETIGSFGKHNYQFTESKSPSIGVEGYNKYTCMICGDSYKNTIKAYWTQAQIDTCGSSLIEKVLPRASYSDIWKDAFDLWHLSSSINKNKIKWYSLPNKVSEIDIVNMIPWEYGYLFDAIPSNFLYNNDTLVMHVMYNKDVDNRLETVYNECKKILKDLDITSSTTQYDAIVKINDWICKNKYYDTKINDEPKQDVYCAMFTDGIVCHGYAQLFQVLCLSAGIECYYYKSNTMNHAWNKVYFSDGSHLWVDVTWNDSKNSTKYLLITDEQLLADDSPKKHTL